MRSSIPIAIIGWLFVAVGVGGLVSGTIELFDGTFGASWRDLDRHEAVDLAFATASRVLSIVGGAFLLRGRPWARWVLLFWMAFHLVLSAMHSVSMVLVHVVLFAPILYFLFPPRPRGSRAGG